MTPTLLARLDAATPVADAVLYEGYLLYPYRPDATKNRYRWQFGVAVPADYRRRDPSERSSFRTVTTIEGLTDDAAIAVRLRFLHLEGDPDGPADAVVRDLGPFSVADLVGRDTRLDIRAGTVQAVAGTVEVGVEVMDSLAARVTVTITNDTVVAEPQITRRADALRWSLLATHLVLAVDGGVFRSSFDDAPARRVPGDGDPGWLHPCLVGARERATTALAAPIVLDDDPRLAPQSAGDLFDATEIDEILALRILTLTDDEKAAARRGDARAAEIIDRCEAMTPEDWTSLHGTLVDPTSHPAVAVAAGGARRPWWEPGGDDDVDPWSTTTTIDGTDVGAGTQVRLRPSHRADAQDLFLDGLDAMVAGVFANVDGDTLVAVTVVADPAGTELAWQGRYLFFHPDELEPVP